MFVASGSTAAQTAGEEYETIVVPQNDRYVVTIGDNETFENKVIDISASGATFRIEAYGSDWAIRNVGVKGEWDVSTDGHEQAISCRVDSGTGVIDNFYFGDGVSDDTFPGVTGIYVQRTHAGTLRINNANIQGCPNNGIYASNPGTPENNERDKLPGKGGVTEITNSYSADCLVSHFRVANTGSVVKNCVAVNGDRGVWAKFGDVAVIDSDLSGHARNRADGDVVCGTNVFAAGEDATLSLKNTTFGHCAPGDQGINYPGTINGSTADRTARTSPPAGVPLTAEEAASGGGTDSTGDTSDGTSRKTMTVETVEGGPLVEYEFTVNGSVVEGDAAEANDSIAVDGDTTTVSGATGNGYTDSFEFEGTLVDWNANVAADHYAVLVDGEAIDPAQIGDSDGNTSDGSEPTDSLDYDKVLVIDGTKQPDEATRYRFTVSGQATRDDENTELVDGGIAWDNLEDDVAEGSVVGLVGNGIDAFGYTGQITDIDIRGDATFTILR